MFDRMFRVFFLITYIYARKNFPFSALRKRNLNRRFKRYPMIKWNGIFIDYRIKKNIVRKCRTFRTSMGVNDKIPSVQWRRRSTVNNIKTKIFLITRYVSLRYRIYDLESKIAKIVRCFVIFFFWLRNVKLLYKKLSKKNRFFSID